MKKILIVEDQFIEANNLQMILERAGYLVIGTAKSVTLALAILEKQTPDLVLLDILLQGKATGIDLAKILRERGIAFVYLSANSNQQTLNEAKVTRPYGFLVKPFREKDLLVMLDIAWYLHEQNAASVRMKEETRSAQARKRDEAFKPIIGNSPALLEVFDAIETVASSDASILLLGESGTGKERVADAIHALSPRKNFPLIKVNCAALPLALVESELFGHERGAFTGANEKRIGKFEQANGGTIFLDEIGEMPLEIQVKLLRVLQEKEIGRVGGNTVRVNVRVIAATNRNLEKEVAEGRFRLDLYYRLYVFPITLPPLRERITDIPALAHHFMQQAAKRLGKDVDALSQNALQQLMQYNWPGNIRELENLVERAVLLAKANVISDIQLPGLRVIKQEDMDKDVSVKSIQDNERDHILTVLKKTNGKISGKNGAAELLGINVSTLNSRIKKLGIVKWKKFD